MNNMKKIFNNFKKVYKDPMSIVRFLASNNFLNWMPDKYYLKLLYFSKMKKKLNLDNPKTFNEKLQWLKLYDRNPLYTKLVDKYEVRKYIAEKIGEEYLIPLIGVWDKFDDIDFSELPNQFVLKCTHDSGGIVICKDKSNFDIEKARKKLNMRLKRNYYYRGREWPYKNVKPRIICEKYMMDESGTSLTDYKFYCFLGEPKYCQVIRDRNTNETIDFYDLNWNLMDFTGLHVPNNPYPHAKVKYKKPEQYEKMIEIAKKLSKDFPFVRVDLYLIQNKIYFGELTFYPLSGFGVFDPPEWNIKMGELIKLPIG